ncbi:MAG: tetratricopeptide repeat protein [Bryobacteraceae bacterium]|jgi:tol-pal system protein YbgF
MKRLIYILALSTLMLPGSIFAASKEQQEMQRDIAQLQDQVRTLQSGFDQKMATLETLVAQALDAGNKTNTNVSVLSASVAQTLDRELKDALRPVAAVAAKVDNLNNDSAEVRNSLADLTTQMNRVIQLLTDMNNAIKVLQAPPAPPPPSNTNPDSAGVQPGARTSAPPPAATLYGNANNDYSSGKSDLAVAEFTDFLRFYPDDPFAPNAQYYIGQIHLGQMKYDDAVMDFDAVLERYPETKITPDAYFMKGMALKSLGKRDAAAEQFRTVVRKYPHSDRKAQAEEQLRAMGLSVGAATPARKKKS